MLQHLSVRADTWLRSQACRAFSAFRCRAAHSRRRPIFSLASFSAWVRSEGKGFEGCASYAGHLWLHPVTPLRNSTCYLLGGQQVCMCLVSLTQVALIKIVSRTWRCALTSTSCFLLPPPLLLLRPPSSDLSQLLLLSLKVGTHSTISNWGQLLAQVPCACSARSSQARMWWPRLTTAIAVLPTVSGLCDVYLGASAGGGRAGALAASSPASAAASAADRRYPVLLTKSSMGGGGATYSSLSLYVL